MNAGMISKTVAALVASAMIGLGGSAVSYASGDVVNITNGYIFDNATPSTGGNYTIGDHNGTFPLPTDGGGTIEVGGVNPTFPQFTNSFHLDSEEYSITVGHQFEVEALLHNQSGGTNRAMGPVIFFSANPNIATIDSFGMITGINPGITKITAIYDGQIFEASVWVVRPYMGWWFDAQCR